MKQWVLEQHFTILNGSVLLPRFKLPIWSRLDPFSYLWLKKTLKEFWSMIGFTTLTEAGNKD
jgi:hypothetical protein